MKINTENYREINERKAFSALLDITKHNCLQVFCDHIGKKYGWDNKDYISDIEEDLIKHLERIVDKDYTEDDLIDIINLTTMLYNFKEDKK